MTTFRDLQKFVEPLAQIDRLTQIKSSRMTRSCPVRLGVVLGRKALRPRFKNDTICTLRGHSSLQKISVAEAENANVLVR
jgi:hypothetical protein